LSECKDGCKGEWQRVDETTKALNTKKGVVIKAMNEETGFDSLVFVPGEHWQDDRFVVIAIL